MKITMRSAGAALALAFAALPAKAQWVQVHEQFYLPASHNWQFRDRYPAADRMFNAFDYGHAILYEELYRRPDADASRLEQREYDFITKRVLVSPPRVPLEEGAIEIAYARIAPEAKAMFEWAHILHRQIYDVWADERLSEAQKDAAVAELVRYYKTRPDLAFSSRPKSMELMEGQSYSLAFRKKYPKFNGLIWAYHWLQVGLYDALMAGTTTDERQANVTAAVSRFWQMLEGAPERMPRLMPMTAAVAPRFTERYPEAAIIFDNLHGMHDVISDVLASPLVPESGKRAAILEAARRYRDATSYVMTVAEWRDMSNAMGIQNMGGAPVDFLPELPTPTVALGASHAEGMGQGGHAGHVAAPAAVADPHAGHGAAPPPDSADSPMLGEQVAELYMRMLSDPALRRVILADTVNRRLLRESVAGLPPMHRDHIAAMLADTVTIQIRKEPPPKPAAKKPVVPKPAAKKPAAKPAPKAPAKPVDPHAGHVMPPKPPVKPPTA